jgi:hypothetical protein
MFYRSTLSLSTLAIAAGFGAAASAQNIVWDDGAANTNWSDVGNWGGPPTNVNSVPDAAGENAFFTGLGTGTVTVDNAFSFNRIQFQPGQSYTLAGPGSLTVAGSGTNTNAVGILNTSGLTQTITADVSASGDSEAILTNSNNGNLILNDVVVTGGNIDARNGTITFNDLQITGNSTTIRIDDEITILGALDLDGNVTLETFPANPRTMTIGDSSGETWTGSLTVNNWSNDLDDIFVQEGFLTAAQLGVINFNGFDPGAGIVDGELVPLELVPEPGTFALSLLGLLCVARRRRG